MKRLGIGYLFQESYEEDQTSVVHLEASWLVRE
jgi:hypothetical protein